MRGGEASRRVVGDYLAIQKYALYAATSWTRKSVYFETGHVLSLRYRDGRRTLRFDSGLGALESLGAQDTYINLAPGSDT